MSDHKHELPGISVSEGWGGDNYVGRAAALIEAGIITLEQMPGAPGRPKTSASYFDGKQLPKRSRAIADVRWMRVTLYGNKVHVIKGVSEEEKRRRYQATDTAWKAEGKPRGMPAINIDAAAHQLSEASALFQVGDAVMVGHQPAVVVGPFRLRAVSHEDGEYVDDDGVRLVYRPGYTCRDKDGGEYFWPAHKVRLPDGSRSHLRLVRSRKPETQAEPTTVLPSVPASWPFPIVGSTFMGAPITVPGMQA